MKRINTIINHKKYEVCIEKIEAAEKERIFCRHNISHFLDVARLAMLINLKNEYQIKEELIYAAAFLHDIGRHIQYLENIPHEQASAEIASSILVECGFNGEEIKAIVMAIQSHRDKEKAGQANLEGILYDADKMSRACFACNVKKECEWGKKKNLELRG